MKEKKHWQLELSSLSLKKNKKLKKIISLLKAKDHKNILEIGCDKGVLSYHLRKAIPCRWMSCDTDQENVDFALSILHENVVKIEDNRLPFSDLEFDTVLCVDLLEHLEDDEAMIREIKRVTQREGDFIVTVPHVSPLLFVNCLAKMLGFTKEYYNHKRDGYSCKMLRDKLEKNGFRVVKEHTAVGFFTELIEFLLNFAYSKFLSRKGSEKGSKGDISIGNETDYKRHKRKITLLKVIYPFLWTISLLDFLLFFLPGYILILETVKDKAK